MSNDLLNHPPTLFDNWWKDVAERKCKPLWKMGEGKLSHIEIGPGRMLMFVAPPGSFKTALAMQLLFDGLLFNPKLRATVCNIETHPQPLLDRQLSRLSGIPLKQIMRRTYLDTDLPALKKAATIIKGIFDQLSFVVPPCNIERAIAAFGEHHGDVMLLDYIQPLCQGQGERTCVVEHTVSELRRYVMEQDKGIILLSAANRASYGSGGLASAKDSGSLEYYCDDAYFIEYDREKTPEQATLKHFKARWGQTDDIEIAVDGKHQLLSAKKFDPDKFFEGSK